MNITILTDNQKSWYLHYGEILANELSIMGHSVKYIYNQENITQGDICFILSCSKIVKSQYLALNRHNIVVHASDLPYGKGFSPLQWQILEGANDIVLTLFEATNSLDAGPYYIKERVFFKGTELYDELRDLLAKKINSLCIKFIKEINTLPPIEQTGEESFFNKRTIKDDEIDPNKTIKEQFNKFRIADNENFPLWFNLKGCKYILKIYKDEDN